VRSDSFGPRAVLEALDQILSVSTSHFLQKDAWTTKMAILKSWSTV
jgi:hypothetical protein